MKQEVQFGKPEESRRLKRHSFRWGDLTELDREEIVTRRGVDLFGLELSQSAECC